MKAPTYLDHQKFKLGIYEIDVDIDRTSRFYRETDGITCDCDGCRNFSLAVAQLPDTVQNFLCQFGIDPAKPVELSAVYAPSDDSIFYEGFYHICGTILKGTEPWIQISKKQFHLDQQYIIELDDDHSFFFTGDVHLLEDSFPTPAFQMEIHFTLPWVLSEPNSYK